MIILLTIFSFVFGAIIGSFLNVLILRLPKGQSVGGYSHCPHCRHMLGPLDLFPLLSFLFLKGKCRYCGKPISKRYFSIEMITAELFALAYLVFLPLTPLALFSFLRVLFVIAVLVVVFMIDLEHSLILDVVLVPASVVLLFFNIFSDLFSRGTLQNSLTLSGVLAGAAASAFFYLIYKISRERWIGFGDVKFGFFLGLATPGLLVFVNVFLAYAIGAVIGLILILSGQKKLDSQVPFGSFLAVSSIITLMAGGSILTWYMHLIGLRY